MGFKPLLHIFTIFEKWEQYNNNNYYYYFHYTIIVIMMSDDNRHGIWRSCWGSRTTEHNKQMHHQIPTSSRDGGDKTTADVVRCEAQIETWGVRFMLGGWAVRISSQKRAERLFTPRQHLSQPPRRTPAAPLCPWHHRLSHHEAPLTAQAHGRAQEHRVPHTQDPVWVPTTASNTQICFLKIAGLGQSRNHMITEV